MRQTLVVASLIVVVAAFAGCGKHATEPPPPVTAAAPALIATEPPARSVLVLYDREIWAQFDRELDPRTVDTLGVFLKLDGQRVHISVAYETGARKIHVSTGATLQLNHTYTVEFAPAIKSAEGVPLPKTIFFQFTTNSLRRIAYDLPKQGALAGPLSMLGWGGTQGPTNEVTFHVYAGTDSVSVSNRTAPTIQNNVFTRLLPSVPWPRGSRIYWSVTSENLTTHELMDGTVNWFDVVGAGVAETTVVIPALDHGSRNATNTISYCENPELPSGPGFNAAIHWDTNPIPSKALITGAIVRLTAFNRDKNRYASTLPNLNLAQNDWRRCEVINPGPPYPEVNGLLSGSSPVDSIRVDFGDPRLGAFLEAQLRGDPYIHGTLLRTTSNISYSSTRESQNPSLRPFATIRYIDPSRLGPAAGTGVRNARQAKPATRVAAPGVRRLTLR